MKTIKIISSITLLATLFSCSDDNTTSSDTEKPTITIVAPSDAQEFHIGDEMTVVVDFSDNRELASYKIDIHYSGDGHSHDRIIFDENTVDWSQQIIGELSGKNHRLNQTIHIPLNANNGHYHFGIYALDKAGNQALEWIEFEIHNH